MSVPSNLQEAIKQAREKAAEANAVLGLLEVQAKEVEAAEAKKKADEGPSFDDLINLVFKDDGDGYLDGVLANVIKAYVRLKTGYSHGSDYYDDGAYSNPNSYEDGDDMSDAKEQFAGIACDAISKAGSDLQNIRGFDKVYETLKTGGYKKTEWELAREICKSNKISNAYFHYATIYNG